MLIKSYFRKLCEKKKNPMNSEVRREWITDEMMYFVMMLSVTLLAGFLVLVTIFNLIKIN